jgi:hypothetical protein
VRSTGGLGKTSLKKSKGQNVMKTSKPNQTSQTLHDLSLRDPDFNLVFRFSGDNVPWRQFSETFLF